MSEDWKRWEGQVVSGKYPLLQILGSSDQSGVFLTKREVGEHTLRAAIKLRLANKETDAALLSRWTQAAKVSHPHLVQLFDSGCCEIGGVPMLYVVKEFAEENLAQVLTERALGADEAKMMLEPVLDVLWYLHSKGFVHGHLKPANIMATGDDLKLSSDSVRRTGESGLDPDRPDAYDPPEYAVSAMRATQANSPAGDVWALGMTLFEVLTRNLPDVQKLKSNDLSALHSLQEPFGGILPHCLESDPDKRWTIAQIGSRLRNPAPTPQTIFTPQPLRPLEQVPPPVEPVQASFYMRSRPPRWKVLAYTIGGAAAAGVLVLIAFFASQKSSHRQPSDAQTTAAAVEQPKDQSAIIQKSSENPRTVPGSDTSLISEEKSQSNAVPAVAHPESTTQSAQMAKAEAPHTPTARGAIVQKVMPEVLKSAMDTIQGTVRVSVKVDVDRSGNVADAELASPSASKYFARESLQAAQRWKFSPPKVSGGNVLSTWTILFEYTRDGTNVIPTQETP